MKTKTLALFTAFLLMILSVLPGSLSASPAGEDWSAGYRDFIWNQNYIRQDSNTWYLDTNLIGMFLCDISADQIPELFVYSGTLTRGGTGHDVYTWRNNAVTFVGKATGWPEEQDPAGRVPGLFLDEGNVGYGGFAYVELSGGVLKQEKLTERDINGTEKNVSANQELYSALSRLRATYSQSELYSGIIPAYNYFDIVGMGWDAYLAEYGYAPSPAPTPAPTPTPAPVPAPVPGNSGYTVSVYDTDGEGLSLKQSPDINSTRYLVIPENTNLQIDQVTDTGWGHTTWNGYSGYVYLKYTRIIGPGTVQTPSYGYITAAPYVIYNTWGEGLELRCRPTTASSTFGPVYDGTIVYVQAIEGGWAYVSYNGLNAWCYMEYMRPYETPAPAPQPPTQPVTQPPTQPVTQPPTQPVTQPAPEPETKKETLSQKVFKKVAGKGLKEQKGDFTMTIYADGSFLLETPVGFASGIPTNEKAGHTVISGYFTDVKKIADHVYSMTMKDPAGAYTYMYYDSKGSLITGTETDMSEYADGKYYLFLPGAVIPDNISSKYAKYISDTGSVDSPVLWKYKSKTVYK